MFDIDVLNHHGEVGAFELPLVELGCERFDMGVGGVGPGGLKVCPHLDLLRIRYCVSRAQLGEHFQDGALVVSHVFLMQGFYVLLVDVCGDCLDANLADNILVDKACPQGQMLLLKLEEVSELRV